MCREFCKKVTVRQPQLQKHSSIRSKNLRNSLLRSLFPGNFDARQVRTGLLPPPRIRRNRRGRRRWWKGPPQAGFFRRPRWHCGLWRKRRGKQPLSLWRIKFCSRRLGGGGCCSWRWSRIRLRTAQAPGPTSPAVATSLPAHPAAWRRQCRAANGHPPRPEPGRAPGMPARWSY